MSGGSYSSPSLLGVLKNADFRSFFDQAIYINATRYLVDTILVTNASRDLAGAAGAVYDGVTGVIAVTDLISDFAPLDTSIKYIAFVLNSYGSSTVLSSSSLSLKLSGLAAGKQEATADLYVYGNRII